MTYILRDSNGVELGRSATPIRLEGHQARSLDETWLNLPGGCTVAEEAAPVPVPQSVSKRQARLALLLAGLLDLVQPAIDAIPDTTARRMAQIEWDDSQEYHRDRPVLVSLAAALGLDAAALDDLFRAAATL